MFFHKILFWGGLFFLFVIPGVVSAEEGAAASSHGATITFLWIGVMLLAAKLSGLVERIGQPSVLGELVVGVLLGNLVLLGINFFEAIKTDPFIPFLAELGVIILLFQVGLESNIGHMRKVGLRALLVATVGVVVPFILGTYVAGPWLLPGFSMHTYLFLGAALTATSVGITARVFKDLGKLGTPEAQIVLGAAVIDDVMGLVILAVVTAIVVVGSISFLGISFIVVNAIGFLVASILLGQLLAPRIGKFLSKIHTGIGMKFTLALTFAFAFSYAAGALGLAPIVGAFAAGLVLDPVHFRFFGSSSLAKEVAEHAAKQSGEKRKELLAIAEQYNQKHVEDLIEPLAHFLVPIFFVYTGINVNLATLFNPRVLGVALGITMIAFIGKYVSGYVAGNVRRSLVGFGMVPRGEVGLIFATMGRSLGVVNDEVFSIIVAMVIFTTLLTPPILTYLIKRRESSVGEAVQQLA